MTYFPLRGMTQPKLGAGQVIKHVGEVTDSQPLLKVLAPHEIAITCIALARLERDIRREELSDHSRDD